MGRFVVNAGHENLQIGGVILYVGIDNGPFGGSEHISMGDANAITQAQFVTLDTVIRTQPVGNLIAELAKPHLTDWWARVRTYFQAQYPQTPPITVFITAWLRNA